MATKKRSPAKKGVRPLKQAAAANDDNICFTIMPYGEWPDYYYEKIYCPAIKAAKLTPRRADDLSRPSAITHDIWILTKQAKVILADLTGSNPNVFYELGLGHALAKPAILVTDAIDDIPFDLRSLRVIHYDKDQPDWGVALQKTIQTAIIEVLEAPENTSLPPFLIENQIQSLRQELARLKGKKSVRRNARRAAGSSAQSGGSTSLTAELTQRLPTSQALVVARSLLDKRPQPPDHFIISVLEGRGLTPEQSRRILKEARDKPLPPAEMEKE